MFHNRSRYKLSSRIRFASETTKCLSLQKRVNDDACSGFDKTTVEICEDTVSIFDSIAVGANSVLFVEHQKQA